MKHTIITICIILFTVLSHTNAFSQQDFTMQITLDKLEDLGSITAFPGVKDENSYWYMSKNVKLASNDDGTPKLSFVKWVYNEDNGETEGLGGGVLHCVFGYGATEEQLEEARAELKRRNPKAELKGSVMFKSGTVTVSVPKINDPDKQEIVSIAPAPTIEGANVAVNLQLDKRSATFLWETFNTPNPQVTFNFNMELAGYNSPMEAKITIRSEQIFNHERMQAGVATPWLSADIGKLMDELIDNGAITIEKTGANFNMDEAINRAIEHATKEFFTPMGSSEGPNLSQLAGLNGQEPSFMDRASGLLNSSRQETRIENQRIRSDNQMERDRAERQNNRIREDNRRERERVNRINDENRHREQDRVDDINAVNRNRIERQNESQSERNSEERNSGNNTGNSSQGPDDPTRVVTATEAGITPENISRENYTPIRAEEITQVTTVYEEEVAPEQIKDEEEVPSFALVASYMKKTSIVKRDKVINFKETTPTVVPMPFGGNLGVSRKNCKSCFKEINLDDPVFKQRQLMALVDGFNSQNFSEFINYASIQLKKTHESGELTFDEVRVTRDNFNKKGNLFTLLYGWKGDNKRDKWMDYQYKIDWSFFGGYEFETEWTESNKNTINLSPPVQQKLITIEAERFLLEEANVRSIDVTIIYNLGGGEDLRKQYLVNTSKDILNGQVEIMMPKNKQEYQYEITWRLWGGNEVKSSIKTTSSNVIQVDELPKI